MKYLAKSMITLAGQLRRLNQVPKSDQLGATINEFPGMMREVVDFIQEWLIHWTRVYQFIRDGSLTESVVPVKYILVAAQKDKVIELRDNLNDFAKRFDRDLLIEIRVEQGLVAEKKELDDLVSVLGGNKLELRKSCMEGTRSEILQAIETEVKNAGGHNVIWIRGSPGVGKSALAASISTRLQDQGRHVISFRFDRTQSATITTDSLWRVVACDLARLYPSFRQHLVKHNKQHSSSDIDRLFKNLIETPLSILGDVPCEKLPVIVIDALDECGGLRHDSSAKDDYEGLLRTLMSEP